jgi:hypothetical protein
MCKNAAISARGSRVALCVAISCGANADDVFSQREFEQHESEVPEPILKAQSRRGEAA